MAASHCSFCGRSRDDADYLFAGPRAVAICDECAALANEVAAEVLREDDEGFVLVGLSRIFTQDARHGEPAGALRDHALVVRRGIVTWLGPESDLPGRYGRTRRIRCGGRAAVPGFVDASVRVPRGAPLSDPVGFAEGVTRRLEAMLARGVTCVDLRLGGSGDPALDGSSLAAGAATADRLPITATRTWVVGPMAADDIELLRPVVGRLAGAVEIGCVGAGVDGPVGTLGGFSLRVRTCPATDDGCAQAADLSIEGPGAVHGPDAVMPLLEIAPALCGAPLPARRLWDRGRRCALGGGSGPGGAAPDGPGLAMALAVGIGGLSVVEALWSVTRGGALAIGHTERGRLRLGAPADIVVLDTDDPSDLVARPDADVTWKVMAGGYLA